jgi:hypothetical protein
MIYSMLDHYFHAGVLFKIGRCYQQYWDCILPTNPSQVINEFHPDGVAYVRRGRPTAEASEHAACHSRAKASWNDVSMCQRK